MAWPQNASPRRTGESAAHLASPFSALQLDGCCGWLLLGSSSWALCALGGSAPTYVEVQVEAFEARSDGGGGAIAAGDEVSYMHYSGCTVASVDTGSSPLTCSIHVPGVGTRDGVAVDQVRRLARPEAAEHDELEDRIMTEVRILRERLAAGSGEEDEDAMRAVFERRIMLLEEEMSSRRRGPERLMARGGPGSRGGGSRQTRIGVMTETSAQQSLSSQRLHLDEAWLLQGNRVTKGTNTVSRSYPAFIESVNVGDRIGVMVDGGGQLSYYLNGSLLGAASPGLPTDKDLYLVLDLQASLRSVRLLPEITKPMTQQELEKDLLIGIVKSDQVSLAALEAKVAEPDGSDAAKAQDRRKRLPLHYLCQNGKADAEMLRCLTGVDSATIGAQDEEGNTSLLCLLKMASTANVDGHVTCDRGHALQQDPRRFNYCDVCRATSTKYRCSESCDYDMCDSCFQKKMSKVKKPKGGPSVDMVRHLVETNAAVVQIADGMGKLPLQVADELGLSRSIVDYLLEATQTCGVVWCGAPNVGGGLGIHLLVHGIGDSSDPVAKQLRFDTAFQALSAKEAKDEARGATKLNNLPFEVEEVAQSVCGPEHAAFVLHDGRLFRLQIDTVGQQSSARVPSAAQQRLDSTRKDHDYHKMKLKETEDALAKLDARRYPVPDDEIEQLVAISAKTHEECKDILSRYAPGGNRMSLASNEVFGVELAGGEVDDFAQGDKKGELKYAIKSIKKKVAQVESRVNALSQQVDAEKEASSAISVLTVGALEAWNVKEDMSTSIRQIAATRSELVALSATGALYSWPWDASEPAPHARAEELCPAPSDDPIAAVSCSELRTSVLTRDGKIASWMDPMYRRDVEANADSVEPEPEPMTADEPPADSSCARLEHEAKLFAAFDAKPVKLAASDHGTCAATSTGSVYWWGQRPWPMRLDRFKSVQESDSSSAVTDRGYQDYLDTFSKKERKKAKPREELARLVADSSELEEFLAKEEGGSPSKESQARCRLLRRLNRSVADTRSGVDGLHEGDLVVSRPRGEWCLHPTGASAVARIDGRPTRVRVEQAIHSIEASHVDVTYDGKAASCFLPDLMMLDLEQRPKQVILSRLDTARGVAVTCDVSEGGDSYDIVDVAQLTPKCPADDELDAIVTEPIRIMENSRLREPIAKYAMAQASVSPDAETDLSGSDQAAVSMCSFYAQASTEPVLAEFYSSGGLEVSQSPQTGIAPPS